MSKDKSYTEEDITEAINLIQQKSVPVLQIAKQFKIPRTTINSRLNKLLKKTEPRDEDVKTNIHNSVGDDNQGTNIINNNVINTPTSGPIINNSIVINNDSHSHRQKLTPDEEDEIIKIIRLVIPYGLYLTKNQLIRLATVFLEKRYDEESLTRNMESTREDFCYLCKQWLTRFMKRHQYLVYQVKETSCYLDCDEAGWIDKFIEMLIALEIFDIMKNSQVTDVLLLKREHKEKHMKVIWHEDDGDFDRIYVNDDLMKVIVKRLVYSK